jgi:hypothetical protein
MGEVIYCPTCGKFMPSRFGVRICVVHGEPPKPAPVPGPKAKGKPKAKR